MGGSTEQVARYKLGAALAEASPYLLLLSATPHQGKTDQFMRLMQLLDRDAFPDEGSVSRERVRPFVIRTEKRAAINAEGQPLVQAPGHSPARGRLAGTTQRAAAPVRGRYRLRAPRLQPGYGGQAAPCWLSDDPDAAAGDIQHRRDPHNAGKAPGGAGHAAAPSAACSIRLARTNGPISTAKPRWTLRCKPMVGNWKSRRSRPCWSWRARRRPPARMPRPRPAGADLQAAAGRKRPGAEGAGLHRVRAHASDAGGLPRKPGFLGRHAQRQHGYGRPHAGQQIFAQDARVLISTDAGGEGLNLQFCHVIVNFDMPWNPMRIEQRIGRVDRIGQQHVVRAINFVLEDTVEHRVRQVLEEKLAVIAEEFGVDKASDVMDSVEADPLFDELFVHGWQIKSIQQKQSGLRKRWPFFYVLKTLRKSTAWSNARSLTA